MASVAGLKAVIAALRKKAEELKKAPAVVVGFTAQYAIYVHENLEPKTLGLDVPRRSGIGVYWGPAGGPKFLEAPSREMAEELAAGIKQDMADGMTLEQALLRAGLQLQAEAQERVPVEHGALKSSAFTKLEKQ